MQYLTSGIYKLQDYFKGYLTASPQPLSPQSSLTFLPDPQILSLSLWTVSLLSIKKCVALAAPCSGNSNSATQDNCVTHTHYNDFISWNIAHKSSFYSQAAKALALFVFGFRSLVIILGNEWKRNRSHFV